MDDNSAQDELLYFNGLNASGGYLTRPLTMKELRDRASKLADNQIWGSADHKSSLGGRADQAASSFRLGAYIDPKDFATTGWGIIFPAQAEPRAVDTILEALGELCMLRAGQAKDRYHIYRAGDGYRPAETGREFAARHGVAPGSVRGDKLPYYLLIVADPQSIPFQFQYELDVQFAVGRIYFESLDEYAQYARSVLLSETPGAVSLPRRATFFGVANGVRSAADLDETVGGASTLPQGSSATVDPATRLSYLHLIQPLVDFARQNQILKDWTVEQIGWDQANKARLLRLLDGSDQAPALLFSASHGLGFPYGDPQTLPFQGSLICQDWPGPNSGGLTRDMYLAAEDIASDANLLGSVAFFFACFGAGTPYWDDYAVAQDQAKQALAHRAFLAALPKRLLSLPRGGALAVVGHVERAWGYSFKWKGTDAEPDSFKDFITELMMGQPVGHAMEYLNDRYATIATDLVQPLEDLRYDPNYDPYKIAWLLTANNDARSYAIIGDPAVRIPLTAQAVAAELRPPIAAVQTRPGSLPVVLVLDAVEPAEKQAVQAEIAAEPDVISFSASGDQPSGPPLGPAPEPQGSGSQSGGSAAPPTLPVVHPQGGPAPAPASSPPQPYSSPIDGLAFALQVYGGSAQLSFSVGTEGTSFNIIDDVKAKVNDVVTNLNSALQNVSQKLLDATNDVLTLEVTTCLVDNLDTFDPSLPPAAGTVETRFLTTISATGDIKVYLPRRAGGSDDLLLQVHKEMVQQALSNRLELVKSVGELVASLFSPQK